MVRRNTLSSGIAFVLALGAHAALAQTTWHVDAAFCPGPGNGSPSNPFCRIQDGIAAALPGDTVLVSPGTYVENLDFLGKAIELRSARGPLATIVDGGLAGACVSFVNGEGPASVLQGFTLTNGSGRPVTGGGEGGGIACLSSSPTIRGNRIVRNASRWGGGIACRSGASPTIVDNLIADNTAPGAGGGLYLHTNCAPRLENNLILRNRVASATGGGLYIGYGSTPTLVHNTLYANGALNAGGAFSFQSNATLLNCIVWGNTPNQMLNVVNVTYSDVQGGLAGTGNVNADPLFADPASDDLHLRFGSPCIDTGTSGGSGFDFEGDSRTSSAAPDMGADEFATRFYLSGVPRPWNTLELRFLGAPSTSPVFALLSTDFLPAPLPIPPFGELLLLPPFTAFPMGALSAQGTLSVPVLVPGPGGYSLALQALIGTQLSNGLALYVP